MPAIRAVFVTVSPLLADIIQRALRGRVEIRTVARITTRHRITMRLRRWRPDVVLIRLRRGEDDSIARSIVEALPQATVIAISPGIRHAYIHEMRPHRTVLANFSRGDLIEQILRRINRP